MLSRSSGISDSHLVGDKSPNLFLKGIYNYSSVWLWLCIVMALYSYGSVWFMALYGLWLYIVMAGPTRRRGALLNGELKKPTEACAMWWSTITHCVGVITVSRSASAVVSSVASTPGITHMLKSLLGGCCGFVCLFVCLFLRTPEAVEASPY